MNNDDSSKASVQQQNDAESRAGRFRRFNSYLKRNGFLIDVYIKLIGTPIAIITIVALVLQLRGVAEQNAAITEQNATIARQTELIADQNEVIWQSNRPTLKIEIHNPFNDIPGAKDSSQILGRIKFTITNVGASSATLRSAIVERLTESEVASDTVDYSNFEIPITDGFNQHFEFSGSRNTVRYFQVTLNYGWTHSSEAESDFTLRRSYIVQWKEREGWVIQLKPAQEYENNRTMLLEHFNGQRP